MPYPGSNDELVARVARAAPLYVGGGMRDERVLDAMRAIDRAAFLPPESRYAAYVDEPVSIGEGQTCSQPSMVAFMLDKLGIGPGCRVLEVGYGSGYAAAIASLLCAPGGLVYAAEMLPSLASAGRANCAAYRLPGAPASSLLDRIAFIEGDGSAGFPRLAPFDRILLSAGVASRTFKESILLEQLAEGGILLYPQERGRLFRVTLTPAGVERESWSGVAFVPLRGVNS
jgi:protein-L-isoaspartate(D-aspartate) O-methyltransferase